jgi:gamma-glutamyltranspeptidase/glutathione hydrolase
MCKKSKKFVKKQRFHRILLMATSAFFLTIQCVSAQERNNAPEPSTPVAQGQAATGKRYMVVTSHPEATKAGEYILQAGGGAVDAAVAVQLVLGLVEPQSSGIGGGGFALYYEAATKQVYSFDGRETAPKTAGRYLFSGDDGKPMDFYEAAVGGRAVGVPGMMRLLEMMHKRFGRVQWKDLFNPAITLSENGFKVTPRLAAMVDFDYDRLSEASMATRLYFMPDSTTPIQTGDILKNAPYARVLKTLATQGAGAFYNGDIPQNISRVVRDHMRNPGLISPEDFANYKAIERKTVCGTYRAYMICTMGEPSAGGITLLETLGILENFNLAATGKNTPASWHLIAEASRLAFADRNFYLGDPYYNQSPGEMLASKEYTKVRATLIDQNKAATNVAHGVPAAWQKHQPRVQEPVYPKPPGTAHFVIVDAGGNVVSMTSSVEDAFGSRLYVDGFMLNNQLTDFSFTPEVDGKPVANRVEGGKRPRSSMAPVIMFDPQGQPFLMIGSAGGSAIPGYILQRIIAIVDWKMDLKEALAMPNILHRGSTLDIEVTAEPGLEDALAAYGHPVSVKDLNSGLTAIHFKEGTMFGFADPRREGTAAGQ